MKKLIFSLITFLITPFLTSAQAQDIFFEARVTEILNEQTTTFEDGTKSTGQNIKLIGTEEPFLDQEVIFIGITDYDVINKNYYQTNDHVIVAATYDHDGNATYYITDYVRKTPIKILFGLFIICLIAIGRWKGVRSLASLALSFGIISYYLVPQILAGANPMTTTLIGSFFIFLSMIYITEGWRKLSHIASFSVIASLSITIFLSWFFVKIAHLTGLSSEETGSLIHLAGGALNLKGLLLASIIIGALGVLDDVIVSQIATVRELHKTNPELNRIQLYQKAMRVGISHISSMTNTLFLAYTGASLPLIILFASGDSAFQSIGQIINNEEIATEIVRTLAGSIGLILSVPISTWIASVSYKAESDKVIK